MKPGDRVRDADGSVGIVTHVFIREVPTTVVLNGKPHQRVDKHTDVYVDWSRQLEVNPEALPSLKEVMPNGAPSEPEAGP